MANVPLKSIKFPGLSDTYTIAAQEAADIADLKSAVTVLEPSATSSDIGKTLVAKTVSNGKVTAYEFGEAGGVDPSEIADAVDDWMEAHPEATTTVQDDSLTEAKFTAATQKKVLNNYVTPEMYGAIGDGTTDDTRAIQDMFDSDNTIFVFSKKTYLVDGPIDVAKACEIHFDHTEFLAKSSAAVRDFEYVIAFKALGIKTYGRLFVRANSSVNVGIWLSEVGGSYFDELAVLNARIWGVYMDKTKSNNNGVLFNKLSASQCGYKVKAKAKYLSSSTLEITDITGNYPSAIAETLFDNRYRQANKVIDDSLYSFSGLKNRYIFYNNQSSAAFALDENDKTKAVFTVHCVGITVGSNYVGDSDTGRDVLIPIGGGVFLASSSSEGAININCLVTQSNPMSFYIGLQYGGNINVYSSEYDTVVMQSDSLHTNINYMYTEAIGSGYENLFGNSYDRIIQIIEYMNPQTFVQNPFIGIDRVPYSIGQNVVLTKQGSATIDATNLSCPGFLSASKLTGYNVANSDASFGKTFTENSPRLVTVDSNGFGGNSSSKITLNVYDLYSLNGFEPITFYLKRRLNNSTNKTVIFTLSQDLITAGYTIRGATNNELSFDIAALGNCTKITAVLFAYTKEFFIRAETFETYAQTSVLSPAGDTHTLLPYPITYDFGQKSALAITVTDSSQYRFMFVSPSDAATDLTINGILWRTGDTVEANKKYLVDIWNGIAKFQELTLTSAETWDYEYTFTNNEGGEQISVTEGQTLTIEWDCPEGNSNGWVLNGNSCCSDIARLSDSDVGRTGRRTLSITATGTVRVGAYSSAYNFSVQNGTIKVRLT